MYPLGTKSLLGVMIVCFSICGCGSNSANDMPTASIAGTPSDSETRGALAARSEPAEGRGQTGVDSPAISDVFREDLLAEPKPEPFPEVLIRTSLGDIKLRLNAEQAPETVDNFLHNYVDRDYYSETIFHFVDPEYIIMAGGYNAELQREESRSPIRNEAHNGLKNRRGTIAMSRPPDYTDSATSEFFINVNDNEALDHTSPESSQTYGYCVFGEVVEGMDIADRIANTPVTSNEEFVNLPVEAVVIQAIERIK